MGYDPNDREGKPTPTFRAHPIPISLNVRQLRWDTPHLDLQHQKKRNEDLPAMPG